GQVADADTEQDAGIPRAAGRDEAPYRAPVAHRPAPDVPRPERQVGAALDRGDQPRDVGGVVREVAVHLEDQLGAVGKRAPETGEARRTEPLLALALHTVHGVEL